MRMDGQWLWGDDGVMRPVISGEILAADDTWAPILTREPCGLSHMG
jgi:hypothetical protein